MAKKKNPGHRPPPEPGHHWVLKKDVTGYWRKNCEGRPLNTAMQQSAASTAVSNEAAKRVTARLLPFTACLKIGNVITRMAGAFKKSLLQHGEMNYDQLRNLDFQPEKYTFSQLTRGYAQSHIENGRLHLNLSVGGKTVQKHSKLPTGYFVELILLWGNPGSDKELRVDSTMSQSYTFEEGKNPDADCLLAIDLPEQQVWMAMVKVTCTGNDVEKSPKYNGMKVLRVGRGYTMLKPF